MVVLLVVFIEKVKVTKKPLLHSLTVQIWYLSSWNQFGISLGSRISTHLAIIHHNLSVKIKENSQKSIFVQNSFQSQSVNWKFLPDFKSIHRVHLWMKISNSCWFGKLPSLFVFFKKKSGVWNQSAYWKAVLKSAIWAKYPLHPSLCRFSK